MTWKLPDSKVARKLAKYSFIFFLVKGLLWLLLPGLIAWLFVD